MSQEQQTSLTNPEWTGYHQRQSVETRVFNLIGVFRKYSEQPGMMYVSSDLFQEIQPLISRIATANIRVEEKSSLPSLTIELKKL